MIYLGNYFSSAWEFLFFILVKIALLTMFIHDTLHYGVVFLCCVYLTEVTQCDNCALE